MIEQILHIWKSNGPFRTARRRRLSYTLIVRPWLGRVYLWKGCHARFGQPDADMLHNRPLNMECGNAMDGEPDYLHIHHLQ